MIKVKKEKITFSKDLDVKYSGKLVKETDKEITLEGEDEESYLKIYNPFHRVAKLILYEGDTWVDADTSSKIGDLDLAPAAASGGAEAPGDDRVAQRIGLLGIALDPALREGLMAQGGHGGADVQRNAEPRRGEGRKLGEIQVDAGAA